MNWHIDPAGETVCGLCASQQARGIESMLGQCWDDVVDGGPTLTQH